MTIQIYNANAQNELIKIPEIIDGCWVRIYAPTKDELESLQKTQHMKPEFLNNPLDINEGSHIEKGEDQLLIILRAPIQDNDAEEFYYESVPIGIILQQNIVYTICVRQIPILSKYVKHGKMDMSIQNKKNFIIRLSQYTALLHLTYLKKIEAKHEYLEQRMRLKKNNADLIHLHHLKKSLVYFTSSLKGNIAVIDKLKRNILIKFTEEELDLMEEVRVDLHQALGICDTYTNIIISTLNTFTSLIGNDLSLIMKILTSVTIFLTVPTLLTSIYGMNLNHLPFAQNAHSILLFTLFTISLISLLVFYFNKKKWV